MIGFQVRICLISNAPINELLHPDASDDILDPRFPPDCTPFLVLIFANPCPKVRERTYVHR